MSDKGFEGFDKMNVECVREARTMGEAILRAAHRGPGDTVEAAMHRAERLWGVPAAWLHRLRYRHDLSDLPTSAFFAIVKAYRAVETAGERAYRTQRELADDESNPFLVGLARLLAGEPVQAQEEELTSTAVPRRVAGGV
jgi:hypothetical protein